MRKLEGKTRKDRVRNTAIRETLKMGSIIEEVEKRILKWYEHLIRMNNERKRKQMTEVRHEWIGRLGWPRKEWEYIGEIEKDRV